MRLTRIELDGYRGFDHATFDLRHPDGGPLPVAAIVGPNGSGKSSVLNAVTSMLTWWHPAYGGRSFAIRDISGSFAQVKIELEDTIGDETVTVPMTAEGTRRAGGWSANVSEALIRWNEAVEGESTREDHPETGIAIAFDAHRLLPPIEVKGMNEAKVTATARGNALAPSLRRDSTMWFRFAHLEQWIVNLDHLRARAKADRNEPFPLWDLLVAGLDEILAPVRFEGVDEALEVRFATPKGSVTLSALSDGFRSVFVIVAELVLRLSLASEDPYAALDQRALCLIDELDAHLHPRWQSQIVRGLQRLFPKVQFIVTTHSPFVVASLEPHEVFRLGDIDP